jgi:putative ABC transport system substrate-binding protein
MSGADVVATTTAPAASHDPATITVTQKALPVIGYLGAGFPDRPQSRVSDYISAFQAGLQDYGYEVGRDVVIENRWAGNDLDRFPDLVEELIRLPVDVIFIGTAAAIPAVRQATATNQIPVVMALVGDAVGSGDIASIRQPGGNITGLTYYSIGLNWRRMELLKRVFPDASKAAFVSCPPRNAGGQVDCDEVEEAARALGMELSPQQVITRPDVKVAFAKAASDGANALFVRPDAAMNSNQGTVTTLAATYGLPAVYPHAGYVQQGSGLLSFGPNRTAIVRRAAAYVYWILKGMNPAVLPIEGPTQFEMAIHLEAAERLRSAGVRLEISERLVAEAQLVLPSR